MISVSIDMILSPSHFCFSHAPVNRKINSYDFVLVPVKSLESRTSSIVV